MNLLKDTLFFDGQCPLCTREINSLRKLAGDQLALTDIHLLTDDPSLPDRETLLKQLHLRKADGQWITGVEASVQAWSHTRAGFIWKPLRWPLIRSAAARVYQWWAVKRYQRLYGTSCQVQTNH